KLRLGNRLCSTAIAPSPCSRSRRRVTSDSPAAVGCPATSKSRRACPPPAWVRVSGLLAAFSPARGTFWVLTRDVWFSPWWPPMRFVVRATLKETPNDSASAGGRPRPASGARAGGDHQAPSTVPRQKAAPPEYRWWILGAAKRRPQSAALALHPSAPTEGRAGRAVPRRGRELLSSGRRLPRRSTVVNPSSAVGWFARSRDRVREKCETATVWSRSPMMRFFAARVLFCVVVALSVSLIISRSAYSQTNCQAEAETKIG